MESMAMVASPIEVADETFVKAAQNGDRDAFAQLVARYRRVAFGYAAARLRSRDEAEDVVQEAFVRAWLALPRMRAPRCWGAWQMQIVRNLCHDAERRRRVRHCEPIEESWPDDAPTPEHWALEKERDEEIRRAVAALPDRERLPLVMHYAWGLPLKEIALALQVPETTVVGRLSAAMRRLRRRFAPEK